MLQAVVGPTLWNDVVSLFFPFLFPEIKHISYDSFLGGEYGSRFSYFTIRIESL